jgi:hypothetical protein
MKERVLRLWKKHSKEDGDAKENYQVWKKHCMDQELKIESTYQNWVYIDWAWAKIHLNIETDKIIVFSGNRKWEEA